jgi:AcrR family transcriptional regulator
MKPIMTADTRERLIENAIDLILTSGYSAVGVKELCQHAHLQKNTSAASGIRRYRLSKDRGV